MKSRSAKQARSFAILPSDRQSDRSLFVVLSIFTFLATVTIFAFLTGLNVSSNWGAPLSQSLSVQIKTQPGAKPGQDAAKAQTLLKAFPSVKTVTIIPKAQSRAALKPWLGTAELPSDFPIPILIDITLKSNMAPDIPAMHQKLIDNGIHADIDDHKIWLRDIRRKMTVFKLVSAICTLLVLVALMGAIVFATRTGIQSWTRLMDVLEHIGAKPGFTARLFAARFFKLTFKAGLVGTICAFLLALLVALAVNATPYVLNRSVCIAAIATPSLLAIIAAITAWQTVFRILLHRIYP